VLVAQEVSQVGYPGVVTEWLSVPECAEALGVSLSRVRELLKEKRLMSVRRGENNAIYIPAGQIMEGETARYVLATVHGTALVLADGGFSDDEIVEWLLAPHDELDGTPLDALRAGQRAHVRRLAQTAL
jgi:excisionase family DNA binding protein